MLYVTYCIIHYCSLQVHQYGTRHQSTVLYQQLNCTVDGPGSMKRCEPITYVLQNICILMLHLNSLCLLLLYRLVDAILATVNCCMIFKHCHMCSIVAAITSLALHNFAGIAESGVLLVAVDALL
jgi:hypothetical protein